MAHGPPAPNDVAKALFSVFYQLWRDIWHYNAPSLVA
eukprot:CAMPEP_0119488288 /NCGR_PEP_ID=MMETSP1344-20130328/14112_1 /TAXON_ID=236787 /ORGANISM="Florenciella parvula, Strain CCMP2471" /LENGTH=36 /DNA_ID= /DNA_START= /DNA_END= /DNA_ORIENTATION=